MGTSFERRPGSEAGADEGAASVYPSVTPCAATYVELLPQAACVVDGRLQVLQANPAARRLFETGGPLGVDGGRLRCRPARIERHLLDYAGDGASWTTPISMRIGATSGRRTLLRMEKAAGLCPHCHADTPKFLLEIFQPTHQWSVPQRLLEVHYGLTPAEARVVRSLLGGLRVQTAAQELHLSPETVRKHLKHAMRKLDVSTQAQMVQVIASGPGR